MTNQQAQLAYPYPAPAGQPQGGNYMPPPPAGYPVKDGQTPVGDHVPATTQTREDGFWKGCCAAICCCCLLDACF